MNGEILARLIGQSDFYTQANTAGVSSDDAMTEIPNGGNSLNWILGHMVYWRNEMLGLIGGTPLWPENHGLAYRGHPGERQPKDFDPAQAFPLERLNTDFGRLGEALSERLVGNDVDAEALGTAASLLAHEVYHAGQLGALRRILGRDGAV